MTKLSLPEDVVLADIPEAVQVPDCAHLRRGEQPWQYLIAVAAKAAGEHSVEDDSGGFSRRIDYTLSPN